MLLSVRVEPMRKTLRRHRAVTDRAPGPAPRWAIGTWLFLRLLGVVYLIAFWSLESQILGLVGADGIAPAHQFMADARAWATSDHLGLTRVLQWPTVFWLESSDGWLVGICRLGMLCSLPLALGIGSAIVLPILWCLYLSLATVTGEFLAFQWDALLLEAGIIAVVLAPWRLVERPGQDEPPAVSRWLVWWLLFRLMFASGAVKLASGDPLWRSLDALTLHFETQPLPTPVAWYAHQLPAWLLRAATAIALAIELLVPWFIVLGTRWRRLAAGAFVILQASIAVTGNYAFFNLLSAGLALTLVDDGRWRTLTVTRWLSGSAARRPSGRWQWLPAALLASVTLPISVGIVARQVGLRLPGADWALMLREQVQPLRSVNAYGLFAVMTPSRPEISIEGSLDGDTWHPFTFRYKPGDPTQRPEWIAPYQPRLDWQMWFAALGEADESPWLEAFCRRLLEGSPSVTRLLAATAFPTQPPRYVRAVRSRYRLSTVAQRRRDGRWWTLGATQPFLGPLSLDGRDR